MSAKKNAARPVTTPKQPEPEEKARKEPKSRPVIFRAKRGEKAAVVCGTLSAVYDGPVTITLYRESDAALLAYYGSKLSEHMTETDEGFLICQNVPIARTGYYEYLPREIGRDGDTPVRVFRSEEAVFSPAAMASFEGKPVTLGHPPVNVTPENGTAYICGHVQNVHRGRDEDSDLLLADLFITSAELIRRIKGGLREVSCGYECKYSDAEGEAEQHHIRGNHVAVVEAGRAGNRVAIKDEKRAPKARLGSEDSAQRSAATVPSEARSALTGEQKGGPQGRLGGEYSPQGYTAAVPGELRSNLTGDRKGGPQGRLAASNLEREARKYAAAYPAKHVVL